MTVGYCIGNNLGRPHSAHQWTFFQATFAFTAPAHSSQVEYNNARTRAVK